MGNDRQTEPELKRRGPTRVRDRCINASVTCDPRQNKEPFPSAMTSCGTSEHRSRILPIPGSKAVGAFRCIEIGQAQALVLGRMVTRCLKLFFTHPTCDASQRYNIPALSSGRTPGIAALLVTPVAVIVT